LSQVQCEYSSLKKDTLTCLIYGEHNFQFFTTEATDTVEQVNVLIGESKEYNLIHCASSFLKLGGILLISLLLL